MVTIKLTDRSQRFEVNFVGGGRHDLAILPKTKSGRSTSDAHFIFIKSKATISAQCECLTWRLLFLKYWAAPRVLDMIKRSFLCLKYYLTRQMCQIL